MKHGRPLRRLHWIKRQAFLYHPALCASCREMRRTSSAHEVLNVTDVMPQKTQMKSGFLWALGVWIVLIAGCGSRPDFFVSSVEVIQSSWDSVEVALTFEERDVFGNRTPVIPDESWTTLFSADYDTLYVGSELLIPVEDVELGDREELLVEACGLSGARRACEQRTIFASPKKMEATSSISFPESDAYDRGTYRFDYTIYRSKFDSEEWTRIKPQTPPETYLHAYVRRYASDAIDIPVRRTRNRFNLTRFPKYRDFRFHIGSDLMDADSAQVNFDLYARFGSDPVKVSRDSVVIRVKSQEERLDELALLVELAGGDILTRLQGFYGLQKAYVFINEWSYQPLTKLYVAEIELHWQSGFQSDWYDMTGALRIKSDGTAGQYVWQQGSRTAEQRWFSRIDGTVIRFDSLRSDVGLRPRLDTETGRARPPQQ
jgi:hypothetical protein